MTIVFRDAQRIGRRFLIGLGGGTGSGKTLSALLLAIGLAGRDGKIAVVDTEDGRALEYAPSPGKKPDFRGTFPFSYTLLGEPYTPARYQEYISAAAAIVGQDGVVIVDSMSHEHEGPGGLLEMADDIARAMAAKHHKSPDVYSVASWREPKKQHWIMLNNLKKLKPHLIFCFRAKEKLKMVPGKPAINRGIKPISEEGLPYEMDFFAIFDAEKPGVPSFSIKSLSISLKPYFIDGQQINEELGRRLRDHAAVATIDEEGIRKAARAKYTEGGSESVTEYAGTLTDKEKLYLRSIYKEVTKDEKSDLEGGDSTKGGPLSGENNGSLG